MISKVLFLASCLVYVNAGGLVGGPAVAYGPAVHTPTSYAVNTGHSTVQRTQDAYGNYMFGYNVNGHYGDNKSRYERRDGHGNVMGYYTINDIDGRARRVDYIADALGFRANVQTNEPGTLPSAAGAVAFNGGALRAPLVAAGPALAAPIQAFPAINYGGYAGGYTGYGFGGLGANAFTFAPNYGAGLGYNRLAGYGAY